MTFKCSILAAVGLTCLASTVSPAYAQTANKAQVSKDESGIKNDNAQSSADAKEVKRLTDLSNQATTKARQAHEVFLQKAAARKTAVQSYGGKDPRAQQAAKDEAAARQEWTASLKEQQQIGAQRKAAIEKLDAALGNRRKDVNQLESDEGKPHAKAAAKPKPAPPKN